MTVKLSQPPPDERSVDLNAAAAQVRRRERQCLAFEGEGPHQRDADAVGNERGLDMVEDDAGRLIHFVAARVGAVASRGFGSVWGPRGLLFSTPRTVSPHELDRDVSGPGVDEKAVDVRPEVGMILILAVRRAVADRLRSEETEETPRR